MERIGFGIWLLSSFPARCRLWTSTMPKSMFGKWLMRSSVGRPKRVYLGQNKHVICLFMARLRTSWPRFPSFLPLPHPQAKARVFHSKLLATLPPMPSACAILLFVHRACMWAVASLRLLVRPWSLLVSSALACALPLMVWMLSYPCARPNSIAPMTSSGRRSPGWLLDTYNFFIHTLRFLDLTYRAL